MAILKLALAVAAAENAAPLADVYFGFGAPPITISVA